jgi:hypothetical protein
MWIVQVSVIGHQTQRKIESALNYLGIELDVTVRKGIRWGLFKEDPID